MVKKAQAGIEYLILIGILLVFIIPIISYSLNEANISIKLNQLDNSIKRLSKAVNTVYALGPGSKEVVAITLPKGVEEIKIEGKNILFKVTMFGGISDVHAPTIPDVIGTLPIEAGTYHVSVLALENNTVELKME